MNETTFCYWLQGFFELSDSPELTTKQIQQIKDHLNLVFHKVTPDRSDNFILDNLDNLDNGKSQKKYCLLSNDSDINNTKIC